MAGFVEQPPHGVREVSCSTRNVSHGARNVSYDCILSTTSILQLQTLENMFVIY